MRVLRAVFKRSRWREVWRCRTLTPDWFRLTLAYLHVANSYPLVVRTSTGNVELQTKYDVATFWLIYMAESYPKPVAGSVVVDAGANIGIFTLYVLQNCPQAQVIALEPAPDSFQRIAALLERHNFTDRCELLPQALGAAPGNTFINLNPASQFRSTSATGGFEVPVISLEALIAQYGPVDYLKIDIEGDEYPSLLSAPAQVLEQIGVIAMEFHPAENYRTDQLFHYLTENGFTLVNRRDDAGGYGLAYLERAGWKASHHGDGRRRFVRAAGGA